MNDAIKSMFKDSVVRIIYFMILVVFILSSFVGGLFVSLERSRSETDENINMYHVASIHDVVLLQKEIQSYQIHELQNGRNALPEELAIRADTAYNVQQIWSAITQRQLQYKGREFNAVVDKADSQVQDFINILSEKMDAGTHGNMQILTRIRPLIFSMEQLGRLHMVSRHTLLKHYERKKEDSLKYIAFLVIALIISVFAIVYHVFRIVRKRDKC